MNPDAPALALKGQAIAYVVDTGRLTPSEASYAMARSRFVDARLWTGAIYGLFCATVLTLILRSGLSSALAAAAAIVFIPLAAFVIYGIPRLLRPRSKFARDFAITSAINLYVGIYILANSTPFAQLTGYSLDRASSRRKAYDKWRESAVIVRGELPWEAWHYARALARTYGYRPEDYQDRRFSTEAQLLLWCAEQPEDRLDDAARIFAHLIRVHSSSEAPDASREHLHLKWLTASKFEILPELANPTRRARILDYLTTLKANPLMVAIISAIVGGTITAIVRRS